MIPGKHMLMNAAVTSPINLLAAMTKSPSGSKWQYLTGPAGIYSSLRAGHQMDKGELSEGDALLQSGLMGYNIGHILEPHQRTKPQGTAFQKASTKLFGHPHNERGLALAASTLGIGLPLYFYYRQGLKQEGQQDDNNTGGVR